MNSNDIIFLLGPSGSGKSQLATWVKEDLNFLKIEVDEFSGGSGIDGAGLRPEWNDFHDRNVPGPIAKSLRNRVSRSKYAGAIVALPSGNVFPVAHIRAASLEDMSVIILFGSIEECRGAFLEREERLGRGLANIPQWDHNNLESHASFSRPEFSGIRIAAFDKGGRRSREELISDVRRHIEKAK